MGLQSLPVQFCSTAAPWGISSFQISLHLESYTSAKLVTYDYAVQRSIKNSSSQRLFQLVLSSRNLLTVGRRRRRKVIQL